MSSRLSIRWGGTGDKSILTIRTKNSCHESATASVDVHRRMLRWFYKPPTGLALPNADPALCLNISCTFGIMQTELPQQALDSSRLHPPWSTRVSFGVYAATKYPEVGIDG